MSPRDADLEATIASARAALAGAEALLISAGAGLGVDSGLPDFRGNEGFWRAYPPFARLGLSFIELANPRWFTADPALAWGFYGHRLELYRATTPHPGFSLLRSFAATLPLGAFVFTSNVDGQFDKAGFDPERIVEVHGSIHHGQCLAHCRGRPRIFPLDATVDVDPDTMRARAPLPTCPYCRQLARPNILMFGDSDWDPTRSDAQDERFGRWLGEIGRRPTVVVEIGAGTGVPTVRRYSESVAHQTRGILIRINPREPHGPPGTLSLPLGGLEGLCRVLPVLDP